MRLKLGENLGWRIAESLRDAGHDVATVRDEELGGADDDALFARCRQESRCLVTLDLDFGNVLRFPPEQANIVDHFVAAGLRPGGEGGSFLQSFVISSTVRLDGVRFGALVPDGAAARAGMRAGDIIVRLGEMPVQSFEEPRAALDAGRPRPGRLSPRRGGPHRSGRARGAAVALTAWAPHRIRRRTP